MCENPRPGEPQCLDVQLPGSGVVVHIRARVQIRARAPITAKDLGGRTRGVSTEFQPSGAAARALATTVALALAALACGDEPAPQAPVARPVKIFEVRAGDAGPVLEFPGRISPARQADMGFEVPGKLIEFPAQESQRVSEGTVLARLDPRDYQSALDKERAYLNKAKTDLERFEFLYKQGVNPLSDLERHQRNFEIAEANYETAENSGTNSRKPYEICWGQRGKLRERARGPWGRLCGLWARP